MLALFWPPNLLNAFLQIANAAMLTAVVASSDADALAPQASALHCPMTLPHDGEVMELWTLLNQHPKVLWGLFWIEP
jgi:hypothetical protein